MNKHACTSTSPIDDYSQQYLALPIPSSRVNTIGTLQAFVHIVTVHH